MKKPHCRGGCPLYLRCFQAPMWNVAQLFKHALFKELRQHLTRQDLHAAGLSNVGGCLWSTVYSPTSNEVINTMRSAQRCMPTRFKAADCVSPSSTAIILILSSLAPASSAAIRLSVFSMCHLYIITRETGNPPRRALHFKRCAVYQRLFCLARLSRP